MWEETFSDAYLEVPAIAVLSPKDPRWQDAYNRLPNWRQDIGYRPEYAALMAKYFHKAIPLCAIGHGIMYPFVLRQGDGWRDIRSIYGLGGPNGQQHGSFTLELKEWCEEHGIMCGFNVVHPFFGQHGEVIGKCIMVDLTAPKQFSHAVRKNIKKAERANITITGSGVSLMDFRSIYEATLDRHHARPEYYLQEEFYLELERTLRGHFRYYGAWHEGRIVSVELILMDGHYAHSFLGGTLESALPLCPNHLLKRQIIRELHRDGFQYYILGGGDPGVLKYKGGFAPAVPLYGGCTIFDQAAYDGLRQRMAEKGVPIPEGRFQFYD